ATAAARVTGLPAPHLDGRAASTGQVLVLEVDRLDDPLVAGQVDDARPRVLLEVVLHRRVELLAVREHDLEVEELDLALLHDERQLRELALGAADGDGVAIDTSVDGALAQLDPALVVPAVRLRGAAGDHDREQECE